MISKVKRAKKIRCDSCDVLVINNLVCHEFGCPKKPIVRGSNR